MTPSYVQRLQRELDFDLKNSAILAIDMHRGHFDPAVGTMSLQVSKARTVIANSKKLLEAARNKAIPVIFVILEFRNIFGLGSEALANPFMAAMHKSDAYVELSSSTNLEKHNRPNSLQSEIIPELGPMRNDYVVKGKRRASAFMGPTWIYFSKLFI